MKILQAMKSSEYKELLVYFFGEDIVLIDNFPEYYLEELKKLSQSESLEDDAFKAIKIAQHTEFCFVLDDRQVGIFQNQYIVAFNAGVASFDFIGDTISNWIDYFGSSSDTSEADAFKLLCHQKFNTPITTYDKWDDSYIPLIEELFK